jgi:hypothetical protein
MLSQVKSLTGLAVLRDFRDKVVEQRISEDLRNELKRLEDLDAATRMDATNNDTAPGPFLRQ